MKRLISLLLCLAMCVSLCACGGGGETGSADQPSQEKTEVKESKGGKENYVSLDQEIDLGFAKIVLSEAKLVYVVGGNGIFRAAPDGKRMFSIEGSLENTCGNNLPVENIMAEMTFNGEYTYTAKAIIIDNKSFPAVVSPLEKAGYCIYAEVPENLLNLMADCELKFSFNDDFASVPESIKKGDHCFAIKLDETVCEGALNALNTPKVFFKECSILPTPDNFAAVRQASSSSSSSNGKLTSIKYGFSCIAGRNDSMDTAMDEYIAALENLGFTVAKNGSSCDIYSDGVKLATVNVSGTSLQFDIVPGNENLNGPSADKSDDVPAAPVEEMLHIGDVIETDYLRLALDQVGTASEIRSGTNSYGRYMYYYSENGHPYIYLSGTFKNLGGAPVDIDNAYIQFCFDGKYNYKGSLTGIKSDYGDFIEDISPLSEVDCYVYADVPQELLDSYEQCVVRIGFTEDFDYRVVDTNDLPKFENCDDVFTVEIKK